MTLDHRRARWIPGRREHRPCSRGMGVPCPVPKRTCALSPSSSCTRPIPTTRVTRGMAAGDRLRDHDHRTALMSADRRTAVRPAEVRPGLQGQDPRQFRYRSSSRVRDQCCADSSDYSFCRRRWVWPPPCCYCASSVDAAHHRWCEQCRARRHRRGIGRLRGAVGVGHARASPTPSLPGVYVGSCHIDLGSSRCALGFPAG